MLQWLLLWEMSMVIQVQILDETFCISLNINTLKKSIHPTVFPPAIGE